jgi:hypothetical protein
MAQPTDAARSLLGSLVQERLITQYVIAPGINSLSPWVLEIILQRGGNILDTCTKLHFSIPASLKARSKECNSSLCVPTPFVKKILLGTKSSTFRLLSSRLKRSFHLYQCSISYATKLFINC